MKITVKAKEFIYKVNLLRNVVPAKSPLPVLTGILVSSDMTMIANNSRTGLSVKLHGEQSLEGYLGDPPSYVIPGRKIIDICNKIKVDDDDIATLDFNDDKMVFKVGKSRFTLRTLPADQFPAFPAIPDTDRCTMPGEDLVRLLKSTVYAVSTLQVRMFLCGVFLKGSEGVLTAMATDQIRFAIASMSYDVEFPGVVIPTEFAKVMISTLRPDTDVWLTVADNQLVCGQDDIVMTSLLIAEKFPEETPNKVVVDVKAYSNSTICKLSDFSNAIDMALLLANPLAANRIMLNSGDGVLNITANAEVGEALNVVDAEISGAMESTYFNGAFVKNVLNVLDGEKVTIKYTDHRQPVLISNENTLGIIVPLQP